MAYCGLTSPFGTDLLCVTVETVDQMTQRFTERFAETKLRTERSLNPKLINSSVDFVQTNQ